MEKINYTSSQNATNNSHPFWRWFWLSFLVLSLTYALHSFYSPPNEIEWINTIASTNDLTKSAKNNALLFFTGKWCSPCQIMKRKVFADNEVEKLVNSRVTPFMIDIDDPINQAIVKHYKIGVTPTTMIVNRQGEVLEYVVGKIEKEKFIEILLGY